MGSAESPETASSSLTLGATMGRVFLTVDEAAERLGVTRSWIYERTRRNASQLSRRATWSTLADVLRYDRTG